MMKTLTFAVTSSILGLSCLAGATPAAIENVRIEVTSDRTPDAALDAVGRGATAEWAGWSVPAVPEGRDVCCFTNNFKRRGCSLSDRDNSWGTSDSFEKSGKAEIYVLVEKKKGRVTRVRIVSPSCSVDGADRRLVWLGAVDPGASIAALSRLIGSGGGEDDVLEPLLAAIAYHADPRADAVIEKRALDRSLPEEARKQAIFWAGNARGAAGYHLLERVIESEPSADVRQHTVFAMTQSSEPRAIDRIKRVAVEDRSDEVRGQALFWLSQTKAPGAGQWILERLDRESEQDVREQAIFALSQLPDGTDWLLRVLRSKRDPETIRRALFWLGQSDDPRALEEIEKILER